MFMASGTAVALPTAVATRISTGSRDSVTAMFAVDPSLSNRDLRPRGMGFVRARTLAGTNVTIRPCNKVVVPGGRLTARVALMTRVGNAGCATAAAVANAAAISASVALGGKWYRKYIIMWYCYRAPIEGRYVVCVGPGAGVGLLGSMPLSAACSRAL